MNIAFLTTVYPGYRRNGGDQNSQRYVDALRRSGATVDLFGYLRKGDPWPQGEHEHVVEERLIETSSSGQQALWWMLDSFARGLPYSAGKYRSRKYVDLLHRLHAHKPYDLIVMDYTSRLAWMVPQLPKGVPFVCVSQNIEHQLYERQCDNETRGWMRAVYAREAREVKRAEEFLARTAREIWAVTAEDAAWYAKLPGCRARAYDTPPSDIQFPDPLPAPRYDIGLIGNWEWVANVTGLRWFVDEVLPKLPESIRIEVGGKGGEWLRGREPRLVYRGYVKSSVEFLCEARVIAVPSTSGAGIQIKSLEALALGQPVVATEFALRGIRSRPPTAHTSNAAEGFARLLMERVAKPAEKHERLEALAWAESLRRGFDTAVSSAVDEILRHPTPRSFP